MQVLVHHHAGAADFDWLSSLPRQILDRDWYGDPVIPGFEFTFGVDEEHLWFLAARAAVPEVHPEASPGVFTPELWKYDVAEFFLFHPSTGEYREFNLSPNGAWWTCGFRDVRQPNNHSIPDGVKTRSKTTAGGWLAMACIPLDSFIPIIGGQPGKDSLASLTLAVTAILDTPDQIFLTTGTDTTGAPDFHRPDSFSAPVFPS